MDGDTKIPYYTFKHNAIDYYLKQPGFCENPEAFYIEEIENY